MIPIMNSSVPNIKNIVISNENGVSTGNRLDIILVIINVQERNTAERMMMGRRNNILGYMKALKLVPTISEFDEMQEKILHKWRIFSCYFLIWSCTSHISSSAIFFSISGVSIVLIIAERVSLSIYVFQTSRIALLVHPMMDISTLSVTW